MAKKGKNVTRVLIVDDHPVVREGIRMCLKRFKGVELAGEAVNGAEALKSIEEVSPDVILLDLVMPRMGGLEALPGIRRISKARVIVFTYHNTREHVQEALAAHVDGYLLKDSSPADYVDAIRTVMAGNFFVSPAAREHLGAAPPEDLAAKFGLDGREFEYFALASRGDRPAQIAKAMQCAESTVRVYRRRVFKKLKVTDVAGLTRLALEIGL